MADIHASLEVLALVKTVGEAVTAAKADGSINIFDLPKVAPVISALRLAVADGKLVPEELKDLNTDETAQLIQAATDAVMALVDAFIK